MYISMEIFKLSAPQVSSSISFFIPKPSIQFSSNTNYYKFRKFHYKPYPYRTHFPLPRCSRLHISTEFSQRSPRRNSLRRKLASQVPTLNNDESNLAASGSVECVSVNQIDSEVAGFGRVEGAAGDSVLWNKLEGWIEQYKNDIEFWGLGSGPIFTVHQDLNGNVERVLVDEDEIARRSGILLSESGGDRELEDFDEVSSKLSHARFVAKEMEAGINVLPKSSSVVKFVGCGDSSRPVSGMMSSDFSPNVSRFGVARQRLVSGIWSGLMRFDFVPNVSRFGIAPLCGLLLVCAVKKFFSKGEGANELTRLQKEMLRRKIKSRKKAETLKDGSIEVVPELVVPAAEFVERPHLDKEELMNSIRAAMMPNSQIKVLDAASTTETDSVNFENRIQEIREMANHAREADKREHSLNEQPLIEIEAIDALLDAPDNLKIECSAKVEGADSIMDKETEKSMDTYVAEVASDVVLGERGDMLHPTPSTLGRVLSKVEKNSQLVREEDGQGNFKVSGENYSGTSLGQSSLSKEASRKKLRVIRSVAEAREYLSDKQQTQVSNGDILEDHIHKNGAFADVGENNRITGEHMSDRLGDENVASDASDPYSPSNTIPSTKSKSGSGVNGLNGKSQHISVPIASAHDSVKNEDSDVDTVKKAGEEKKISGTLMPDRSVRALETVVSKEALHDPSLKEDDCLKAEINGVNFDGHNSAVHSTSVHNSSCHHEDADADSNTIQCFDQMEKMADIVKPTRFGEADTVPSVNAFDDSGLKVKHPLTVELDNHDVSDKNQAVDEVITSENSEICEDYKEDLKIEASTVKNTWLEKNFDELMPVLEKMGSGFTDNYTVAREKLKQQELDRGPDLTQVISALNDNSELEWMNDDKLKEIVFKVRDNEVAGRDPFHSMDDDDKVTFFKGLEDKVEKETEKLSTLHEWLHSNIENLDYGADGISVYDPPEKIIPRWKGAPFEKIREFLANSPKGQEALDKETDFPDQENLHMKPEVPSNNGKPLIKVAKKSTVIESSDGSVKPGKRTGKEQWQHTKKHSRGFLESYNAETDPEIKEVMRDMGKDLDRWITEDEIKKAANLMGKLPQRSRAKAFVEKKLNKVKSEVERFGTQAVLNKYREYAVEEKEDYLWWLDLPYVLGIELYTQEGDEMKVGFYTLEMAADLELDPKPYHVIAFEDPGECKNLCYVIQSHLEMLGKNDKAFAVAQPPKDAFQDAKANGFGVTVIRKGQVALNVDQPLEEVEELICEIGSKMYHDKITKERSVDIRSVMKGVLATSKPAKRKSGKRRRLRKPKN